MNSIRLTRFPRILGDHPSWEYKMAVADAKGMAQQFAMACDPIFRALYGVRRFYGA